MKAVIVGDLHLHESYLDRCHLVLDKIVEVNNNFQPDIFVFLGDLFESKDRIPNVLQELVDDFVHRLNVSEKVFIVGNHDISSKSMTAPFLNRITMRVSEVQHLSIDDHNLVFIGYHRDYKEFRAIVSNSLKNVSNAMVFCHNQILPFKRNSYTSSDTAIDVLNKYDVKYAFAGHIHQFLSYKDKYFHVGSVFQRDFRDCFFESERNFHGIILFEDGNLTFVDFYSEIKDLPVYITIRKNACSSLKDLVKVLTEISTLFPDNPLNIMIYISNNLSSDEVESLVRKYCKNVNKLFIDEDVSFEEAETVLEINKLFNVEKMLEDYVMEKNVDNKEELISIGLEILNACGGR